MMKIIKTILVVSFILASFAHSASAKAMRIVSLKPTITDVIVAMGHGDKLVGVTKYCQVPAGENKPAIVGDYTRPHIERIVALQPDIVLGSKENSSRKSIERLKSTGIRVELYPFSTIDETLGSIRKIGKAIGAPRDAERVAERMKMQIDLLKIRWKDKPKRRTIIIWGTRPLIVAGPRSYMNELLGIMGATNALDTGKIPYPRIGTEELIALDPDVIIDLSMGSEKSTKHPLHDLSILKAAREKRIYTMDPNEFRIRPNLPDSLEKMARLIHK